MPKYDWELVNNMLEDMLWAINQIQKRFKEIDTPADFLDNDIGLEKLDSICMQLINIGETLKKDWQNYTADIIEEL
jgi:uncharacterized protein with HEPN domain